MAPMPGRARLWGGVGIETVGTITFFSHHTKRHSNTPRSMKISPFLQRRRLASGKIGYALLWLLGIPLPVLIIVYLLRGH